MHNELNVYLKVTHHHGICVEVRVEKLISLAEINEISKFFVQLLVFGLFFNSFIRKGIIGFTPTLVLKEESTNFELRCSFSFLFELTLEKDTILTSTSKDTIPVNWNINIVFYIDNLVLKMESSTAENYSYRRP